MRSSGEASTAGWSKDQIRNAKIIIEVGTKMGMSRRDIVIGLMTAMQESTLLNLNYGDRDSQGLFQQRTSQGWGTIEQITDPYYSARKFFSVLKTVEGRDQMERTYAAQAVQRSAYPTAYAKWFDDADALLKGLGGTGATASAAGRSATAGVEMATELTADAGLGFETVVQPMTDPAATALADWKSPSAISTPMAPVSGVESQAGATTAPDTLGIPYLETRIPTPADISRAGTRQGGIDEFMWPTSDHTITQQWGVENARYAAGHHTGLDIGAPEGSRVRSPVSGRVIGASYDDAYGNLVVVRTKSGHTVLLAHMSSMRVEKGMRITAGTVVGRVGNTGNSDGAHLHLEIRAPGGGYGDDINPMQWLRRRARRG